jgi:hypothetical protein
LENYFTSLFASDLPFGVWAAVLTWVVLFLANQLMLRSVRVANDTQKFVAVEDWSALRRGFKPQYILARLVFVGVVFSVAFLLGHSAFVFFGGGLIVTAACTLSVNAQALLTARAMARPDAAKGFLTFTTPLALRQAAHRFAGAALTCLVIGFALAHLALLGGTLLLSSAALGYLRRARNQPTST